MKPRSIFILILSMLLLITACSSTGTPTAMLDSQGTYSLETRTGIEEIDTILATVASGDLAQLKNLIQYTTAPCTTLDGFGGPPKCRDGEVEGTQVDGIPMVSSEGSYIRKDEIDIWTGVDAKSLFAVYRVSEDGVEEEFYPRGEYAIVFLSHEDGVGATIRVLDGRIVRVDYPFYQSLEDLMIRVNQDAAEVILMPDIR